MSANHFPAIYNQFIYKSRYARYLESESRREDWHESVARYFDFFAKHLKEEHDYDLSLVREDLENSVIGLEVMPSMRALMTAGPALDRDHIAAYNCLRGTTQVLTKEFGLVNIAKLAGKTVHVWTSNKAWEIASFYSYGKRQLWKLVYGYNSVRHEVFSTDNHDWVLADGNRVQTKNLSKNMVLKTNLVTRYIDENSVDYKLGVMHGIVYGDGSHGSAKQTKYGQLRDSGYMIRLCGSSIELLKYFDGCSVTYPPSYNGDPVIFIESNFAKTHLLKELPVNETDQYMIGFMRGWFAADGSVGKFSGQSSIVCGPNEAEWLRAEMSKFGYEFGVPQPYSDHTNFGVRKKSLVSLPLFRPSFNEDDMLLSYKKDRWTSFNLEYKVFEIAETDNFEEVFCAEVESTHDFTLEKGLLTGNCAYHPMESLKCLDEELYILMNGTGDGFSVENAYIRNIPDLPDELHASNTTIVVEDSKLGWAKAYRELLTLLSSGQVPKWDTTKVRPSGSRLKTFGGRASGPEPLIELFEFTVAMFKNAVANKRNLTSLDVHDLGCMVANIVVVGGVRRAALISLSDLTDDRMRTAKSGAWWNAAGHRRLANNSAVYEERPEIGLFMKEWLSLYESKSGERGIFSREAAKKVIEHSNEFRRKWFGEHARLRDTNHVFGCNPCCVSGDTLLNVQINNKYQIMRMTDVVLAYTDNQNIKVKAFNHKTNEIEYNDISFAGITRPKAKLLKITCTTSGKSIKVTPDHKVWTENRGWVEAALLKFDDELKII